VGGVWLGSVVGPRGTLVWYGVVICWGSGSGVFGRGEGVWFNLVKRCDMAWIALCHLGTR
jgi:hypothetical protein